MDMKNPFIIEMNDFDDFENYIEGEEKDIAFEFSKNKIWGESFFEKVQEEETKKQEEKFVKKFEEIPKEKFEEIPENFFEEKFEVNFEKNFEEEFVEKESPYDKFFEEIALIKKDMAEIKRILSSVFKV